MNIEEVAYLVGTVAGDDDKLSDTCLMHGIDGTLQERAPCHRQEALGTGISQGAQALGHARSENHSNHIHLSLFTFSIVSTTAWVCSLRPRVMRTHDSRPLSLMNLIL